MLYQMDPVIGADILVLVNHQINTVHKGLSYAAILCGGVV